MRCELDVRQPVLVLNGTGRTGRRVVEGLEAREVPTRVASSPGEPLFAWADPGTWREALSAGASRAA